MDSYHLCNIIYHSIWPYKNEEHWSHTPRYPIHLRLPRTKSNYSSTLFFYSQSGHGLPQAIQLLPPFASSSQASSTSRAERHLPSRYSNSLIVSPFPYRSVLWITSTPSSNSCSKVVEQGKIGGEVLQPRRAEEQEGRLSEPRGSWVGWDLRAQHSWALSLQINCGSIMHVSIYVRSIWFSHTTYPS